MASIIENIFEAAGNDYDLGTLDSFKRDMQNVKTRRTVYDTLKDEYDLGEWDSFSQTIDKDLGVNQPYIMPLKQEEPQDETLWQLPSNVELSDEEKKYLPQGYMMLDETNRKKAEKQARKDALGNFVEQEKRLQAQDEVRDAEQRQNANGQILTSGATTSGELFDNALDAWQQTDAGIRRTAQFERDIQTAINDFQKNKQKEFSNLKDVKAIIQKAKDGQLTADEANAQLQDIWEQKYSDELGKIITPINEAYNKDFYEANKEPLEAEITRLYRKELDENIKMTSKEISALSDKHYKEAMSRLTPLGRAMGYAFPASQTELRQPDLEAAAYMLRQAQQMRNAAVRGQGLGSGFANKIVDPSTWDLGISDLNQYLTIKKIVEKQESGKELDEYEKAAMDATLEYMSAQAQYSGLVGRWYKAGAVTAEAVPFMMEFLLMPVESIKDAVVKGIFKYGAKKFGIKAGEKLALDYGIKAAGRLAGSLGSAALMSAVFDPARIAAGTVEREIGTINAPNLLNDGLQYAGRKDDQQGTAEALRNAAVDSYFNNLSEMLLTDLAPAVKLASMSKVLSKLSKTEAAAVIQKLIKDNAVSKALRTMQVGDLGEEFVEEELGNLFKWMFSTDVSVENKNTGFERDAQIDTILGLIPMQATFGILKGSAVSIDYFKGKMLWNDYRKHLSDSGKSLLKTFMDSKTAEEARTNLRNLLGNLSNEDGMPLEMKKDMTRSLLGKYSEMYKGLKSEEKPAPKAEKQEAEQPKTEEPKADVQTQEVPKKKGKGVSEESHEVSVTIDGYPRKISFSGTNIVYNEDGTINFDESGTVFIQDEQGNIIQGNHDAIKEAINATLSAEKKNGEALESQDTPEAAEELAEEVETQEEEATGEEPAVEDLNVEVRTPEEIAAEEAAAAEAAEQQRVDEVYNGVVQLINQKGRKALSSCTPEQKFIWRWKKESGSLEAALERARLGIEEAKKISDIDERDYEIEQWQVLIDKYSAKEEAPSAQEVQEEDPVQEKQPVQEEQKVEEPQTEEPVQTEQPAEEQKEEQESQPIDLTADDIVLMKGTHSKYVFCRRTKEGETIPLNGEKLQLVRKGKETAWVQATKTLVYIDGKPYYMLGSNANTNVVNVVPAQLSMPVITDPNAENTSVIKVEKDKVMTEQGQPYFAKNGKREKQLDELLANAKNYDDVLDYVVLDRPMDGGGRYTLTLRQLLDMFSKVLDDNSRELVNSKQYEGIFDKIFKDMGKSEEASMDDDVRVVKLRDDVEKEIRQRIGEAARAWNPLAPESVKVKPGKALQQYIGNFIDAVSLIDMAEKTNHFTGRVVAKKRQATAEDYARREELREQLNEAKTQAELDDVKKQIIELMQKVDFGKQQQAVQETRQEEPAQTEEPVQEQQPEPAKQEEQEQKEETPEEQEEEQLSPLQILQKERDRLVEMLDMARKRNNQELADDLLKQINDLGKRIFEASQKAEMQTGKEPVTEGTSKVARLVYKALIKSLSKIKGLNLHMVGSQAEARRVLEMIQGFVELQRANDSFNAFLEKYIKGKVGLHDVWQENIDGVIRYLTNEKKLSLRQAVLTKAKNKHNIDPSSLENLVEQLSNPIAVFKSAKNGVEGKVVLIEAKDNKGVNIVVAINLNGNTGGVEVNDITSIYGREHIEDFVRWDEQGLLEDGNYKKFEAWLASNPVNNIEGELKAALQKIGAKIQQKNESSKSLVINFQKNEEITEFAGKNGTIYGWSIGNDMYLTDEGLNPETPIHEYTHIWLNVLKRSNKEVYNKIIKSIKSRKGLWNEVTSDPAYSHLTTDEAIASEIIARYSGKRGAKRLIKIAKELYGQKSDAEHTKLVDTFVSKVQNILNEFWTAIKRQFDIQSIDDISDWALKDLFDAKSLEINDAEETNFDKKFKKMHETLDKGGANVLSLQQISELTDALEDDLRQGNRPVVFERVPFAAMQEVLGRERTLAEALTIVALRSRRQSRALERDGKEVSSDEIASRDASNTEMLLDLTRYAKEKGIWIEDVVETLDEKYGKENRAEVINGIPSGESHVWIDSENGNVVKAKADNQYESVEELLEGIILNNWLFKGNQQHIVGFGIDRTSKSPAIRVIYETPYVDIDNSIPLTQEEKDAFMAAYGFEKADSPITTEGGGEKSNYTNGSFVVNDLHSKNIVRDSDGDIRCTDPIIKWEKGEHYNNPTKEQERKDAENEEVMDALFDGEDIEFMIGDPDPRNISNEVREAMNKRKNKVQEKNENVHTKPAERLEGTAKLIYQLFDNTHGLFLLQGKINEWRKRHGKAPIPDSMDVRSLLNRCGSSIASMTTLFDQREGKHLGEVKDKFVEKIAKSKLMGQFKQDLLEEETFDGKKFHYEPTALDLIERYLIARDNVERAELGIPTRGEREFTERMGMSMAEYADLFQSQLTDEELNELWDAVRACTNKSISELLRGGRISQEEYDTYARRKFYVPEKDFAERETNEDLQEDEDRMKRGGRNRQATAVAHKAEGGNSMATNIFANIIHDAKNSIAVAQENLVRKAMFDLMNDNIDYAEEYGIPRPAQVWFVRTGTAEDGSPIYERTTERPSQESIDDAKLLNNLIKKQQEKLTEEKDEEKRAQIRNAIVSLRIELPIVSAKQAGDSRQLEDKRDDVPTVKVYVNGVQHEMTFDGMQEVADALNGVFDLRGNISNIRKANAMIAAMFTTYNPTFFAVNLARDTPFVLAKGYSQYGVEFAGRFTKALGIDLVKTRKPILQYLNGNLDENTPEGKLFYNFIVGGGNTGYTQMQSIRDLKKEFESSNLAKTKLGNIVSIGAKLNEYSELLTRFAAYKAMIESGYSENQALNAAKNLSVNFNRRGAGNKFINFFNSLSMFSNAALQGSTGFFRTFDSGKSTARATFAMVVMPAFLGFINTLLCPDDDDDEFVVSDYYRDNYCVIGPVKIPVSEQFRPFWTIGVNAALGMQGRRDGGQIANSIVQSFTQYLLPVPPAVSQAMMKAESAVIDGDEGFLDAAEITSSLIVPQFASGVQELANNKDFMGNTIRKYDLDAMPQYRLGENEAELYKDIAKFFYWANGGDTKVPLKYKKGSIDEEVGRWYVPLPANVNPKEVHKGLGIGIPAGWLDVLCTMYGLGKGTYEKVTTGEFGEHVRPKDIPLFGTFYRPEDETMFRYTLYKEMKRIAKDYDAVTKELEKQYAGADEETRKAIQDEAMSKLTNAKDKGFNPVYWGQLIDAYKATSVYDIAHKLGKEEKELREEYPELETLDDFQKMITQQMNEQLMEYHGIEHHIPWLQEKMRFWDKKE